MVKRFDTGELGREGIVLYGEFVLASDYDTLESRIRELEAKLRLTEGAFKNTRIRELEAALREIAKFYGTGGDGNACARIAMNALGITPETKG